MQADVPVVSEEKCEPLLRVSYLNESNNYEFQLHSYVIYWIQTLEYQQSTLENINTEHI